MTTYSLHLNLRAGVALAAVALVAFPACASTGHAAASQSAVPSSTSTATFAGSQEPAVPAQRPPLGGGSARAEERDTCPLRLPNPLPSRELVVPILMYHRINYVTASTPEITRHLTVDPADFARQMGWLKRHGYHTVTQRELFDALMCGDRLARKPIMITFDDGYRDAYRHAAPVLERLGMRATAYVITGRISGSDPSFLTWKQVRGLERRGVEVASHTVSHAGLTGLSDQAALNELVRSRKTLERKLGHRVPWLAYPYGDYDAHVESLARQAGYRLATTTVWGARQSARRPLGLERLRVLDSTHVSGLAAMLAANT
jgi:peptidoglycan/xylan/chitin deacetylase (PgdA/CDA1 family)